VAASAVALVGLGILLEGCSSFSSSSSTTTTVPLRGGDPHRLAAQVDAATLLASYSPPRGSVPLARTPTGPWMGKPSSSPVSSELIDVTRAWRSPGNMVSVIAWAKAHAPSLWSVVETGESGQNPKGEAPPMRNGHPIIADVKSRNVTFSLPIHGSAVESRQVLVSVAPRGTNEVTLRVDVQEVWVPTRPTWSYVSSAANSATATVWTGTNRVVPMTKTSSDPSTVASLRKLVNAMSVSTVGLTSCPADVGQRFSLEFKGPNAPQVTVSGLTAECGGISVIVPGHSHLGMRDAGGRVVSAVEAMTGVK